MNGGIFQIFRRGRFKLNSLTFNIMRLFYGGEQGAWYDPSDLSTLFQDAAGTTPVTAVEQPVGRILDKSGRGNHATQATTTKRPVLSRWVNLLTKTEDFQNAAWITPSTGVVKSNNAGTDPLGGGTAGKVECTQAGSIIYVANSVASGLIAGATYRSTCYVRNGVGVTSIVFYNGKFGAYKSATINLITGAVTSSNYTTPPVVSVSGDGFVSISADIVAPDTTGTYCYVQSAGRNAVGDHFFIWHPSLTLATDAHLPYQRVNTATDYDADPAKFPAYLRFDGVDDALQTGNIDFTSTNKMTVWAGVNSFTQQNGSAAGTVVLHPDTGFRSFSIYAPAGVNNLSFFSMTSTAIGAAGSVSTIATNSNAVVAGIADLATRTATLRANGVQLATSTAASGGGNYRAGPLYIGSQPTPNRNFNGRLYSLIVRGAQSSLSQIEATELYIKQKARIA